MLFGSTDMHLMRKSPCPVWIIKATEQQQFGRILAALDHDPEDAVTDVLNRQILEMSTSLALSEFSELHIVHAWRLACESFMRSPRMNPSHVDVDAMVAEKAEERRSWLENVVAAHGAKADKDAMDYLDPHLHIIKGSATDVIPITARELGVDLVIMGTVGRSGVPGLFMGSTAESILTQLDCSVLTTKPPGFATPVRS
jgi:universal stress protein E